MLLDALGTGLVCCSNRKRENYFSKLLTSCTLCREFSNTYNSIIQPVFYLNLVLDIIQSNKVYAKIPSSAIKWNRVKKYVSS